MITRLFRSMGLALAMALLGLSLVAVSAPTPTYAATSDTNTIFTQTNAARAANGLKPLTRNTAIDTVAANWAKKMATAGTMTHNPSFSTQIPSGWSTSGENVAMGYTAATVVDAWMKSPGHRANILNAKYTDIGIGFYTDSKNRTWMVQNFAAYKQLTSVAQPTITGTAKVASTLKVIPAWGPSPVTYSYQWKRAGVAIAGATKNTYKLVAADKGKTITVTVSGKKTGYTPIAKSSKSTAVIK